MKNVGTAERMFRALLGLGLVIAGVVAPLPLAARVAGGGGLGLYLLATALAGSCLGYKLLGMSTCRTR